MENIDLGLLSNSRAHRFNRLDNVFQQSSVASQTKASFIFLKKLTNIFKNHRWLIISLASILIFSLALIGYLYYQNSNQSTQPNLTAQIQLNQNYQMVAHDINGAALNKKLNLSFIDAKKVSSILIQGKTAQAINGKTFILLDFNIVNPDKTVYFANTSDLFRLVSGSTKTAPAVHQGVIDIRPLSTKSSNVGFLVGKDDKNFTIEVGEIDGNKRVIQVNF